MITFKNQQDRDWYQIAENTPKSRHYFWCKSPGVGALVIELSPEQLCTCWVIDAARKIDTGVY